MCNLAEMDNCLVFAIVLLSFSWCSGCNSVDINISDRFEQMEKKLAAHDTQVATLKKSVMKLENRVLDLETELEATNNISLPSAVGNPEGARDIRSVSMVAFSAFVDHDIKHLGLEQPIPYNTIITNIGNGFSRHTHVFTCPITGLYMFTFTICTEDTIQLIAKLVVDNQNIVDAISEPSTVYHETQGSNSAVIEVSKGQGVWVAIYNTADVSIRSEDGFRFAAFSGFLIQTT